MTHIPEHLKGIVDDLDWETTFKFEEIPCEHESNAKEFQKVDCLKCNCDKRELWIETTLQNTKLNETMTDHDGKILTLKSIKINRGRYDDCIGIQKNYS